MSSLVPGRVGRVHQVNVSKGGVPKLPILEAEIDALGIAGDADRRPIV